MPEHSGGVAELLLSFSPGPGSVPQVTGSGRTYVDLGVWSILGRLNPGPGSQVPRV